MPNRQYEAGDRFEKRVMKDLVRRRYIANQTRGSKGAWDIMALPKLLNPDGRPNGRRVQMPLLVQVKSGERTVDHNPWNALYDAARFTLSHALVADRDGRKIRYRLITGYHTYRSRDWPAENYDP